MTDEELLLTSVHSRTSGVPGRSLNDARSHHFVIDGSPSSGGLGEEITPGEAFLSGISACAVLLVERRAADTGVPLRVAEAWIYGARSPSDTSWYVRVDMRLRLEGPTREQAEELAADYRRR
jgi:uncharacterized OsmC-like protein